MEKPRSRFQDFVSLSRLFAHNAKVSWSNNRWWLIGISLFLVLRWAIIAALHGRI
jgi:hypothetical protein